MRHTFLFRPSEGGAAEEIRLDRGAEGWRLTRGGRSQSVDVARLPDGRWSLLLEDGRQVTGSAACEREGEVAVTRRGARRILSLADPLHDRIAHASAEVGGSTGEDIRAPMPGRVVEVRVAAGDPVAAGALLLVLEAMKMQNEIRCRGAGRVTRVAVSTGEAVEAGAPLVEIASESLGIG